MIDVGNSGGMRIGIGKPKHLSMNVFQLLITLIVPLSLI
jgi:hypothetical protein